MFCRKRRVSKENLAIIGCLFLVLFGLVQYQEFSSLNSLRGSQADVVWQELSLYPTNLSELFVDLTPDNRNNISSYHTQSPKLLMQTAVLSEPYVNQRLKQYNKACRGKEFIIGREPDRTIQNHFQMSKSHKLIYCSIEKAGTTFWRRVLQVLDSTNLDNPYQIKPLNVNKKSQSLFREDLFRMLAKLRTHIVFMFVRNPFKRLLSGYLDKIYTANPFYWGVIGKEIRVPIKQSTRAMRLDQVAQLSKTVKPPTKCYHNISFDEFIQYVIEAESTTYRRRDPHFMAMYDLCKPCQLQYDFIGKMETFKEDFTFIMRTLNISKFDINDLEEEAGYDTFIDVATSLEERREEIVKCLSMHEAYLRSWRHMQIKGLIGIDQNYPFSEKQSLYLKPIQLIRAMKEAKGRSTSKENMKVQKEGFFMDIYRTVAIDKLVKLVQILKSDFDIFEYDAYPQSIFAPNIRKRLKYSDVFNVLR
ncbi:carbohydrate sulfotransferase 10-like [Saccostrea echinata]|uniref:carbohydrate sulfotransferase 10-like n=1 Tax=Saccostrea echinata TaxID=191078 RepID=UPI002A83992E|nr:carbohydrate sulfotransferase 10-like [Saccostrea echinata]